MPRNPRKLLYDMLDSCRFLVEFCFNRTVEDVRNDRGFRSAVERELQIVGEALMALSRLDPPTAGRIAEYQRIIRLRHVLVHGYDVVDPDIIWAIVQEKLPVLISQLETLLDSET